MRPGSSLAGGEYERAEREWAQSEVGEGVEEVWERSVSLSAAALPWDELLVLALMDSGTLLVASFPPSRLIV